MYHSHERASCRNGGRLPKQNGTWTITVPWKASRLLGLLPSAQEGAAVQERSSWCAPSPRAQALAPPFEAGLGSEGNDSDSMSWHCRQQGLWSHFSPGHPLVGLSRTHPFNIFEPLKSFFASTCCPQFTVEANHLCSLQSSFPFSILSPTPI